MPSVIRAVATATFLALLTQAPRAHADDAKTCVDASERGNDAKTRGKLRDARRAFIACAASTCPNPLRSDCAKWAGEIEASQPTLVVGAKDAQGSDLFDVRVDVDGEPVADPARGTPFAVDPGPHVVRFVRPGAEPVEIRVIVRVGEHNRLVVGAFPGPKGGPKKRGDGDDAPPPSAADKPLLPTASWVLGGIGILALGSFGTFAILGQNEKDKLRTSCSPGCSDADVSTLRTDYIVADVSLGIGIVALGVATVLAITHHSSPSPAPRVSVSRDQRFARTIWK